MPEPVRRSKRYMPGLDGLRAIAVLAVIAYHLEFGWAPGGLLGVGIFFTLSGYLITDILLAHMARRDMRLVDFWLGRARRLLPALFLMLVVVVAWVTIFGPAQPSKFRDAVIAAALYVSNWQLIFQHVSYFARFGAPEPLGHLWSLAVEEQFYIFWPFLLLLGTRFIREAPGAPAGLRPRLAAATLVLAAASAIAMAVLYHPSFDPSRVYDGTDTRAFELLAGAALAMVWPSRKLTPKITAGARNVLDGAGALGLVVIVLMIWRTNQYSSFIYEGGLVLLSLATVLVVGALAHPATRLGVLLGWKPLRWIGVRSYGIYLWHFPIIVLTAPSGPRSPDLVRDALQVGATFAIAALSWHFVEEPVRHGALGRLRKRLRSQGWRPELISQRGWAATGALAAVLLVATVGLAGAALDPNAEPPVVSGSAVASPVSISTAARRATPSGERAIPRQSSCRSVVHIGDSTSEGLTSSNYLPSPGDRIEAQYARVGATTSYYAISGARSIDETYEGEPNAYEVAQAWKAEGFHGCWVFALGTNDAADVFVGGSVGDRERIERMMSAAGGEPVLWVNVKSLVPSGPYAESNMREWDEALLRACPRYPNMRVYDWAADVKDAWFIEDGIHFTTPGYRARARLIADALAEAFPSGGGRSPDCVVH
ncbi:MAG TPA: acyltransferase family protein [Solirubrobacterales bacterium]|jgi:peptidoglycan/LPS O-acetylase OafA/YrhL|nr:acyltransferase family protein [Solirubrobacterales bacterium]